MCVWWSEWYRVAKRFGQFEFFTIFLVIFQDTCKFLQSKVDAGNVASIYHASGAAKALGGCKVDIVACAMYAKYGTHLLVLQLCSNCHGHQGLK